MGTCVNWGALHGGLASPGLSVESWVNQERLSTTWPVCSFVWFPGIIGHSVTPTLPSFLCLRCRLWHLSGWSSKRVPPRREAWGGLTKQVPEAGSHSACWARPALGPLPVGWPLRNQPCFRATWKDHHILGKGVALCSQKSSHYGWVTKGSLKECPYQTGRHLTCHFWEGTESGSQPTDPESSQRR